VPCLGAYRPDSCRRRGGPGGRLGLLAVASGASRRENDRAKAIAAPSCDHTTRAFDVDRQRNWCGVWLCPARSRVDENTQSMVRPTGSNRSQCDRALNVASQSAFIVPFPECVQGRCSEKRAIRSSLLPTQMSSPTRMAELTRCIAAI
jgi:hypothetical protein